VLLRTRWKRGQGKEDRGEKEDSSKRKKSRRNGESKYGGKINLTFPDDSVVKKRVGKKDGKRL